MPNSLPGTVTTRTFSRSNWVAYTLGPLESQTSYWLVKVDERLNDKGYIVPGQYHLDTMRPHGSSFWLSYPNESPGSV